MHLRRQDTRSDGFGARFADLPIVVGRWGEAATDAASQGLSGVGATHVAFTLTDARDQILARAASALEALPATATMDAVRPSPSAISETPCRS